MRPAEIRFDGFQWHHNPKKLHIECQKNTAEHKVPYGEDAFELLGERLRLISGEGELYGEDCIRRYRALRELYLTGKRAVLALEGMPSVYAVFTKLELLCEPADSLVKYRFVFKEVGGPSRPTDAERSYVTAGTENLWDIAYSVGSSVEALVALNPWIRTIDHIEEGRSVRIC